MAQSHTNNNVRVVIGRVCAPVIALLGIGLERLPSINCTTLVWLHQCRRTFASDANATHSYTYRIVATRIWPPQGGPGVYLAFRWCDHLNFLYCIVWQLGDDRPSDNRASSPTLDLNELLNRPMDLQTNAGPQAAPTGEFPAAAACETRAGPITAIMHRLLAGPRCAHALDSRLSRRAVLAPGGDCTCGCRGCDSALALRQLRSARPSPAVAEMLTRVGTFSLLDCVLCVDNSVLALARPTICGGAYATGGRLRRS
jgi:hypothetical protein